MRLIYLLVNLFINAPVGKESFYIEIVISKELNKGVRLFYNCRMLIGI